MKVIAAGDPLRSDRVSVSTVPAVTTGLPEARTVSRSSSGLSLSQPSVSACGLYCQSAPAAEAVTSGSTDQPDFPPSLTSVT